MTAAEVRQLIEREIQGDWERSNWHGCDLRRCLVPPTRRTYMDSFNEPETLELWLVLEERPEEASGYKIVYDETEGQFGLAICGEPHDVFIGYYGTFMETFAGM